MLGMRLFRPYSTSTKYVEAMRRVASPVAIITSQHGDSKCGMTVSSLASVSVKPEPVISFNLQAPSRTSTILESAPRFAVNILNTNQQGLDLALAFAGRKGQINPFKEFPEKFTSSQGLPIVSQARSTLICEILHILPVQDHRLVVAKVKDVIPGEGQGIVYHNQAFHHIGEEID